MKPILRDIAAHPIEHQGQPMILLRDPLGLSETTFAIPRPLGPLLGLMDGTRDLQALEAALSVRAGIRLAPGLLDKLVEDLDDAFMLDNERSATARSVATAAYREAPFRPMTLADSSFPEHPEQATAALKRYLEALSPALPSPGSPAARGLICPHIDYQRGGPVYAQVWQLAAQAAQKAELVILFGTDHQGSAGSLTLTHQSYATPWGVLPTATDCVEMLADALGQDRVFAEELHHRSEHSIELASVWLHSAREGLPVQLVPVLCGSFAEFVAGRADPGAYEPFQTLVQRLREVVETRRTLVVAAADLAHVGPAFGDAHGLDFVARAQLRRADERMLSTVYAGDAQGFFETIAGEGDRRNVCGLPPIYLALRLLEGATGEAAGYDLCPADPQGTSVVSIAGVILR